jgi:hypothetical protein
MKTALAALTALTLTASLALAPAASNAQSVTIAVNTPEFGFRISTPPAYAPPPPPVYVPAPRVYVPPPVYVPVPPRRVVVAPVPVYVPPPVYVPVHPPGHRHGWTPHHGHGRDRHHDGSRGHAGYGHGHAPRVVHAPPAYVPPRHIEHVRYR